VLDETVRLEAADRLLAAYATRDPIPPLVETYPGLDLEDAYAIQLRQLERQIAAGRRLVGRKVGLTAAVMQRSMGVDQPDYGYLLDDMIVPEYDPIPAGRYLQPRIEPEIAFVLGEDLSGPGVTVAQALAAVDFVLPALELIDSRIRDWNISLLDTIADNASSGGVVLGGRPTPVGLHDLRMLGCVVRRNGTVVATGAGGAALGSPILALAWLANVLGEHGVVLSAGQVILPGSCTGAVSVAAGDVISATFAELGSVTAVFGQEGAGDQT